MERSAQADPSLAVMVEEEPLSLGTWLLLLLVSDKSVCCRVDLLLLLLLMLLLLFLDLLVPFRNRLNCSEQGSDTNMAHRMLRAEVTAA